MNIRQVVFQLTRFERGLWLGSLLLIAAAFLSAGEGDMSVLAACLIGATALIFVAKGEPLGQLLTVVFALFYGYISLKFRYYGEMITYLGMTAPIALLSLITWLRNPFERGRSQVRVSRVGKGQWAILCLLAALTTAVFWVILRAFDTPNLALSTVSITTSFLASGLTLLRSPLYALAYAANDVVLIGLWVLATLEEPAYLPMVVCFVIFLLNDSYGFFNWSRMKRRQMECNVSE